MAEVNITEQQSIHDFKWKHRLLITQIVSDIELKHLQDKIRHHNRDVNARKLLVIVHLKHKTYVLDAPATNAFSTELASEVLSKEVSKLLSKNQGKVLLIGLDGSIKSRFAADTFALEQALAEIDLMPMRRIEILEKFNG
jgi:hypothetical protein